MARSRCGWHILLSPSPEREKKGKKINIHCFGPDNSERRPQIINIIYEGTRGNGRRRERLLCRIKFQMLKSRKIALLRSDILMGIEA